MKEYIKKLIVSIIFVVLLIILFVVVNGINENRNKDGISLVKRVIKEKYDDIIYKDGSKYICTYNYEDNLYEYDVFDLSGNKLYKIEDNKRINIEDVSKNYFITKDTKYHLYNSDYEEIIDGNMITPVNNYLVKVDDTIINLDNEILFEDVYSVKTYNNGKLVNVNNYYLTDKKGKIIYNNTYVKEEIKSNYITDYLIVNKDNKYYTFFVRIGKIIGDGFDNYTIKNKIYIKNNNKIYRVYKTGLRKKIKKKNRVEKLFVNNKNNDIIFYNKYKTIKKNNIYYLIDSNNKELLKSKKQIVIYDQKIKNGKTNKEFIMYNLNTKKKYHAKRIRINKKDYYYYDNTIISIDFSEKYSSKEYLSYFKNTVFYKDGKQIVFKNFKNDKNYIYKMNSKNDIFNDKDLNKLIILDEGNDILLIDLKGNIIKELNNRRIVDYYEIDNKILFIIEMEKDGIKYRGSYLAE